MRTRMDGNSRLHRRGDERWHNCGRSVCPSLSVGKSASCVERTKRPELRAMGRMRTQASKQATRKRASERASTQFGRCALVGEGKSERTRQRTRNEAMISGVRPKRCERAKRTRRRNGRTDASDRNSAAREPSHPAWTNLYPRIFQADVCTRGPCCGCP